MNNYDVKRLALVLAIQAEIEGMKAENLKRESEDNAQAYGNEQFMYMAEELRNTAHKHDDQL